jgi:hypothetical protein
MTELSLTQSKTLCWPTSSGDPALCPPQSIILQGPGDYLYGNLISEDGRPCPVRWPAQAFSLIRATSPGYRGCWHPSLKLGAREKYLTTLQKASNPK